MLILLNTIERVKEFNEIVSRVDNDIEMSFTSERYTIDPKSILGIFSLNMTSPMNFQIYTENKQVRDKIFADVDKFKYENYYSQVNDLSTKNKRYFFNRLKQM